MHLTGGLQNEAYTESSFYYWKGKFGLSRPYHWGSISCVSKKFAPANLSSPSISSSVCDQPSMSHGEIRIDLPGGIIARFSGLSGSHAAIELLTQICDRYVLSE